MEKDTETKESSTSTVIKIKGLLFSSKKRICITGGIGLIILYVLWTNLSGTKSTVQYQTAPVTKGTLVTSVQESGSATVANRASLTTQASGIVSEVDVKNGDTVTKGQKIAVISLDQDGQQRQAQALSSYLAAKSSLDGANANLFSLQSTMFSKWNTFFNLATNSTYQNGDGSPNVTNRTLPQFTTSQDDWAAAEAAYKNQQNVISQEEAAVNSTWFSYQLASNTITAPTSGTINDLTIAPGIQLTTQTTSGGNPTSQTIGDIRNAGNPVVSVSLSEVDVAKVQAAQKATITFDALPNKSFTGKVLGINTTGVVTSGVTTYPTTIVLDIPNDTILPNMSATVNIITGVKDNVLLIPSSAVQTTNNQSFVRVLQKGQITSVPVEIGDSSDTSTEIVSGLSVADTVVIGYNPTTSASNSSSPFSGGFRLGGFGGGGGFRRGN
jgi:RND family efflux transporter MFP subunit